MALRNAISADAGSFAARVGIFETDRSNGERMQSISWPPAGLVAAWQKTEEGLCALGLQIHSRRHRCVESFECTSVYV